MRKTVNISVGGYPFLVEEDAYESLKRYLESVKKCYGNEKNVNEIINDIEARVGELLLEMRGGSEVVDYIMVEMVKKRIGEPQATESAEASSDGGAQEEQKCTEESGEDAQKQSGKPRRHLYRDNDNRMLGGVCAGIAAYFKTDIVWIRLIWALLFFGFPWVLDGSISGAVLILYLVGWLCIPAARTVEQKCEMHGKPVILKDFKDYEPAPVPRSTHGKPVLGRVLGVCLGLFLLVIGSSLVVSSAVMPFGMKFAGTSEVQMEIQGIGEYSAAIQNLILSNTFWWLLCASFLMLGLLFCYAGCILTFASRRPNWHPLALVLLFVLWLAVSASFAVYCATVFV